MNDGLFSPFSKATCDAFKLLLDLDVSTDTPETLDAILDADNKVNIVIGLTGDLAGEILYRFPKQTTLEMVKIMCGMEIDEIDEFVTSAMGEIANIISGNAVTGLSEQNIICDILPPKVMIDGLPLTENAVSILSTKVKTEVGDVELDIRVSAKK